MLRAKSSFSFFRTAQMGGMAFQSFDRLFEKTCCRIQLPLALGDGGKSRKGFGIFHAFGSQFLEDCKRPLIIFCSLAQVVSHIGQTAEAVERIAIIVVTSGDPLLDLQSPLVVLLSLGQIAPKADCLG